ncbi:MAG TPA: hypothetical protein VN633_25725 [Bryobacteraceae bacterium]|nr:hypothetical protein [Bryobacteraceae bacterium]
MISIRSFVSLIAVCLTLGLWACTTSSESASQREKDANSAAGKVGKAAHSVAKETGKVAAAAGRRLGKAAHQAHEGWKQAEREDDAKRK